jgi:hypothetical protein
MAVIYEKYPVLLCQGFPNLLTAAPGNVRQELYTLESDRGTVKEIDLMVQEYDEASLGQLRAFYTLQAGGQDLISKAASPEYIFNLQLGAMRDHYIKTNLQPSQTLNGFCDNRLGLIPSPAQVQVFYSTPQNEEFIRNFKWKNGLGLKRETFELVIPANAPPPPPTPLIYTTGKQIVPRQNGPIIGVKVTYSGDITRTVQLFFSLKINGVTAFDNVSMLNAYPLCGRYKYVYPVAIQPGSTFELSVEDLAGAGADDYLYVTFFFDN